MANRQLVVFKIGNEEYAIPIEQVKEIIDYLPVTRLPDTPAYFEGIIDVRGKIIPIINLAAKIGGITDETTRQIVIVDIQNKAVGLTVDTVTEVVHAAGDNFEDLESVGLSIQNTKTVCKLQNRIIILLDVEENLLDMITINPD